MTMPSVIGVEPERNESTMKDDSDIRLLSNDVIEVVMILCTNRVEVGLTTEIGCGIITTVPVAAGVGNKPVLLNDVITAVSSDAMMNGVEIMIVDSGIEIRILLSNDVIEDAMVLSNNRTEVGMTSVVNSGIIAIVSVTVSVGDGWVVVSNDVTASDATTLLSANRVEVETKESTIEVDSGIRVTTLLSNNVIEDAMVLSTKRVEIGTKSEVSSGIIMLVSAIVGAGEG